MQTLFLQRHLAITACLLLVVLAVGCTRRYEIPLKTAYPPTVQVHADRVAISVLPVASASDTSGQQKNSSYLGSGIDDIALALLIPIEVKSREYYADISRTDLIRDAWVSRLTSMGLPAAYRPDTQQANSNGLPDGHLLISTRLRKLDVTNDTLGVTLILATTFTASELESSVLLDCQVSAPGAGTPLWQGTEEGASSEKEITKNDQAEVASKGIATWVVRKAIDKAIDGCITKSGLKQQSVRLRSDAFAKWIKQSQDKEAANDLSGAVASYTRAYRAATDPDQTITAIKAMARVTKGKTGLPEDARRVGVQATTLIQERKYDDAISAYQQALDVAPWWAEGHFNLALLMAQQSRFADAVTAMKLYLELASNAPDARAAQDKIYEWELKGK